MSGRNGAWQSGPLLAHFGHRAMLVRSALKSGHDPTLTAGPNTAQVHRSIQPIIIGRKGPEDLKSVWQSVVDFNPEGGFQVIKAAPV